MTLKEESVIEMIAYTKTKKFLVAIFHDSDYNSENELSHWVSIQRDVTKREIRKKKKNI
jgi:hypothetical protein